MTGQRRRLAALGAVGLWSTNAYAAGLALDRMSVGWLLGVQFGVAALSTGWPASPGQATCGPAVWARAGWP